MTPSNEAADEPITPTENLSLSQYVEVCRALIRSGGDSPRVMAEVLVGFGLTPADWAAINTDWTERIRRDPVLRSEFQRRYAGSAVEPTA